MAIIEGRAYWASITVPNTKFKPVYTINVLVDDKTFKEFKDKKCSVKELDEGKSVVFRRQVTDKNGNSRPDPKLIDKDKKPMTERVGNGSLVRVQYREYPWEYAGRSGTGLDLQAVQVLELVEAEQIAADGSELGLEEETVEMQL